MGGLKEYMENRRKEVFAISAQLTLGEVIDKIEGCGLTYGDDEEQKEVCFDFSSAIPTTLDSWRGSYSELALGFELSGYDNDEGHFAKTEVGYLLLELKNAIGKGYTGWKGGEFFMGRDTPIWVDNPGNGNNTGIIDVVDDGWRIILMTAFCDY